MIDISRRTRLKLSGYPFRRHRRLRPQRNPAADNPNRTLKQTNPPDSLPCGTESRVLRIVLIRIRHGPIFHPILKFCHLFFKNL